MSRRAPLFLSLVVAVSLLVAVPTVAAPAADGPSPWWSALAQVWQQIVAPLSSGDDGNIGPDFDPDGVSTTTMNDDDGNMGPDFDPDGLTVASGDGANGNAGPDFDPDGVHSTTTGDDGNMGPDCDPNG